MLKVDTHIIRNSSRMVFGAVFAVVLNAIPTPGRAAAEALAERIVAIPTEGFVAPGAGEHPRLYLRRSEIAHLRAQAETPRGREVVEGLLNLVDGGKAVGPVQIEGWSKRYKLDGFYQSTTFAVLFQITGDARYADLARQSIERFYQPEEEARLRSFLTNRDLWSYGFVSDLHVSEIMSYDLCYEAWEPAFRRQVAERLARVAGFLAAKPMAEEPFDPATPLAEVGALSVADTQREKGDFTGMGFTRRVLVSQLLLLGLQGDPEVAGLPFKPWLAAARDRFERLVPGAFGEHGRHRRFKLWGWMIAGGFQLDEALLAWRNAGGADYTNDERVRWISLQWVAELVAQPNGGCWVRRHEGGSLNQAYGAQPHTEPWNHYPDAFALLRGREQSALLWSWNHTIRPALARKPPQRRWDLYQHSHRALSVLLHWPEDTAEINPEQIIPRPYVDHATGAVVFRNRWRDGNDVMIDCWIGGTDDFRNPVVLWARGKRTTLGFLGITSPDQGKWPVNDKGEIDRKTYYRKSAEAQKGGVPRLVKAPAPSADGSGSATYSNGNAIAVEFTPGAGLDALIAMTGPGLDGLPGGGGVPGTEPHNKAWNEDFGALAADTIVTVGDRRVRVTTIGDGSHPKPTVVGETVQIGTRTVRWNGSNLEIKP
jgi:hypothetical protein